MKKIINALAASFILMSSLAFASTKDIDIAVNGMVCGFCAQGISKKFSAEAAVEKVKVSLETKLVSLHLKDGKDLPDSTITSILKDAGYNVSKIERK